MTRNFPKRLVLPLDGLLIRLLVLYFVFGRVIQGVVCYISENQKKIEKKQKECKVKNRIKKSEGKELYQVEKF